MAAIGLKAHVSEADHPLLCEGTRRQRGDLALLLLVHYKDQPERLSFKILNCSEQIFGVMGDQTVKVSAP